MIDSYILYHQKIKKHIIFFLIIVLSLLLIVFYILNTFLIPTYIEGIGTITDDSNLILEVCIPLNQLKEIKNHNKIMIKTKKYNYQVNKVSKKILMNDGISYVIVEINVIDNKSNIQLENTTSYKIEIGKSKIINQLIKK